MFKPSTLFAIAALLVLSILAPSIITLIEEPTDTVFVVDFEEEEDGKKEVKKELDEKEVFPWERQNNFKLSFSNKGPIIDTAHLLAPLHIEEIPSPPPDYIL